MARRKPRLTKKRADGLFRAIALLEGSLFEYEPDEPRRAEVVTAIEYLQDLWCWYQDKHGWPQLNQGGE